jgi:Na+/melibiose symporter-like transporter
MKERGWVPWLALFGVVAAVELTVRVALPFKLQPVLVVEAVLFLTSALVMLGLLARTPRRTGWRRVLPWILGGGFVLAALRSALWAAGQPVMRANIVVLVLAVICLAVTWVSRRRRADTKEPAEQ